jgi:hypothetical protein
VPLSSPLFASTLYNDNYITTDLGGNSRIIYEYPDMGAYEFTLPQIIEPKVKRLVYVPQQEGVLSTPMPGNYYVEGHKDFYLILYPQEGYTLDNLKVITGTKRFDEGIDLDITRNANGSLTIIFRQITEPMSLVFTGIVPTGNIATPDALRTVWSEGGVLYVQTATGQSAVLTVYTLMGQIYKQQEVGGGKTAIALPPGMYIVALDAGLRQKVVIR